LNIFRGESVLNIQSFPDSKSVPLIKIEHLASVFLGEIFIGVVAAAGQHGQLSGRQVSVEHYPLLDAEDGAAVGIQDEKRAGHRWQHGTQVEDSRAIVAGVVRSISFIVFNQICIRLSITGSCNIHGNISGRKAGILVICIYSKVSRLTPKKQ